MGQLIEGALEARIDALIQKGMEARESLKKKLSAEMYFTVLSGAKDSIRIAAEDFDVAPLTAAIILLDDSLKGEGEIEISLEERELEKDFIRIALVELLETQKDKAALPQGI